MLWPICFGNVAHFQPGKKFVSSFTLIPAFSAKELSFQL